VKDDDLLVLVMGFELSSPLSGEGGLECETGSAIDGETRVFFRFCCLVGVRMGK
jgi:hypothetical protein